MRSPRYPLDRQVAPNRLTLRPPRPHPTKPTHGDVRLQLLSINALLSTYINLEALGLAH
jgi:hypothetical protein